MLAKRTSNYEDQKYFSYRIPVLMFLSSWFAQMLLGPLSLRLTFLTSMPMLAPCRGTSRWRMEAATSPIT